MEDEYTLLIKNISQLGKSNSTRATQAEEWLEQQAENNHQLHLLLRQAITDPHVTSQSQMMCSIYLNNDLINMIEDTPYDQVFTFARQIIRDPTFPQLYFNNLERFLIKFIAKAEKHFIQQWLMLYKELLLQKLNMRAFFVLATFAVAEIKESDFIYFIVLAVPWSIQNILNLVSIGGAVVLHEWSKAMCQILTKLLSKKNDTIYQENIQIISNNGEICKIILMVYELQSSIENGYLSTISNLTQLNILKSSFCQLHSSIMQGFSQSSRALKGSLHYQLLTQTISRLSISLVLVSQNYDKFNVELESEDFVKNIIKLFTQALTTYQTSQLFSTFTPQLITKVIFSALILTQTEIGCFSDKNAQHTQFVHYIEDMFHKHQSDTLKSCCAGLLQAIGDNVDGATTFTINTAINSLKYNLKIIQNIQSTHLSNSQALLVLGILTCCYADRDDIAKLVGSFLSQNSQVILKNLSPIELTILYIFLGYVQDIIFPQNDDGFIYLKHSSICRVHPITQYAALTFLSNNIQNVPSLQILKIILQRTNNCQYGIIWTIVKDFINHNIKIITQIIAIDIVNVILSQINKQIVNRRQISAHTITQCINILRQLIDPKKGYFKGKSDLENNIWRAFEMLKLQKFQNLDDVIKLLVDFMRNKRDVDITGKIYQLMPIIDLRLKEDENLYQNVFPFVNLIINKSVFQESSKQLMQVLEWCLRPLGIQTLKQYDRSEWLLLLQLFLQKNLNLLSPDVIIKTMSLLGQYRTTLLQPPAMLRLLATNMFFYKSSINFPKFDLIKPILSLDYSLVGYSEEYTKKIIVLQLINILFSQTQIKLLTLVLNGIINILSNWKSKTQPRTKKKNKPQTYSIQKYLQSIVKLRSQYKKMDIFEYFSETIQKMRTANLQATTQIINSLSQQNITLLKTILSRRYIAKETQPRKILKIRGAKQQVEIIQSQTRKKPQMIQQQGQQKQQDIDEEQDNIKVATAKKRQYKKLKKNNKTGMN